MKNGTLLDTCVHGHAEKRQGIPIVFSFSPRSMGTIEVGSVVTSMGEFKQGVSVDPNGNTTGHGGVYLKCLSARGICYIRVRNLERHRPERVDESKVIEKPKRLSDADKPKRRRKVTKDANDS